MPKTVEYPRAPLSKAVELARAVDALGGSCTEETCADKLGRQPGGAFSALVSATVKYGLVRKRRGQLSTTEDFRELKHAYTDEDEQAVLREAFLSVPLFAGLVSRFGGEQLPVEILDKLLVREFDVPDTQAGRIAKYFLDGARLVQILDSSNRLANDSEGVEPRAGRGHADGEGDALAAPRTRPPKGSIGTGSGEYVVHLYGPGMDSTIAVVEADDLLIVEAMLAKIRKALARREGESEVVS